MHDGMLSIDNHLPRSRNHECGSHRRGELTIQCCPRMVHVGMIAIDSATVRQGGLGSLYIVPRVQSCRPIHRVSVANILARFGRRGSLGSRPTLHRHRLCSADALASARIMKIFADIKEMVWAFSLAMYGEGRTKVDSSAGRDDCDGFRLLTMLGANDSRR
jgi:hypothetical protein